MLNRNLRIVWLRLRKDFVSNIYDRSRTEAGFLRLIGWVRFVILVSLTVRFGLFTATLPGDANVLIDIRWALWGYFLFIVALRYLADFYPKQFESTKSKMIQTFVDTIMITLFYAVSGDARSNVFLMYFLPALIIARYLDIRAFIVFLLLVLGSSIITGALMGILLGVNTPLQVWIVEWAYRTGYLAILTIFYLTFQRHRQLLGSLEQTRHGLVRKLRRLEVGVFTVDHNLRLTTINDAMRKRHGQGLIGSTCQHAFCQSGIPVGAPCQTCPLVEAVHLKTATEHVQLKFRDRSGSSYRVQISAFPIFDAQNRLTGATAIVQDLSEKEQIESQVESYALTIEQTVDALTEEHRGRVEEMTRQLAVISNASAAALAPGESISIGQIVTAAANLLHCQAADVRRPGVDKDSGRPALILTYSLGYTPNDEARRYALDIARPSVVVKAYHTGDATTIDDVQAKPGLIQFMADAQKYDLHAMACFPLFVQDEQLGTFSMYRTKRKPFTDEEMRLGQALANSLATAIGNQSLLERISDEVAIRQKGLDALSVLSRQIAPHDGITSLAQLVTRITRDQLNTEVSSLFLLQGDTLYREAISGIEPDWFSEEHYLAGVGITGQVVITPEGERYGQAIVDNSVHKSQQVIQTNLRRYSTKMSSGELRHLLAVPLNGQERTFGVLRVVNKLNGDGQLHPVGFTQQDEDLMTTIACMVAVAIENARLLEAEHKRMRSNETLLQTMQDLTAELDLKRILKKILEQLRAVVDYDSASLLLHDEGKLTIKAHAGFQESETKKLDGAVLDSSENIPFRHMVATRRPFTVQDNRTEKLLDPIVGTRKIRSWIGAPLIINDRVIGQLAVDSWRPNKYGDHDAALVMIFAQQAAIAITNADLYAQQEKLANDLLALNQNLIEITSERDLHNTVDKIAQCVVNLLHCDISGVALFDKERQEIRALPNVGYRGVSKEYAEGFRFGTENRGAEILYTGRVHVTEDVQAEPDSVFDHNLTRSIQARGIMTAPLLVGSYLVGILCAASRSPRRFTNNEQTIFRNLANQAAIAIRNVELLDQIERRAQLLDLFHEISIAGQRTSDLERVLNILLTGVTASYGLRFNRAALLLLDSTRSHLVGRTGIGQTDAIEARSIWGHIKATSSHEELEQQSFDGYVREVLKHGVPAWTPIHYSTRNMRIPIQTESSEVFSQAVLSGQAKVIDPRVGNPLINTDFYRLFDPGSFALVPLAIDGRVIGILVADNKFTGAPITADDLELLSACASQAAAAIERTRLHGLLQDHIEVLHHLQEVGQKISKLSDLREVLGKIVKSANEVLEADISYLAPYDSVTDELLIDLAVREGDQGDFHHDRNFSFKGLTKRALNDSSGLILIEDLESQPDLISAFAIHQRIQSVAVVRLAIHNQVVGILYVNYRSPHLFVDEEIKTLQMFADQAAIAIHNARLMEQMKELVTRQERDRLREDLHDTLNTFQFKVMLTAENIRDHLREDGEIEAAEDVHKLWRITHSMYQQFQRILQDMIDPVLINFGLVKALHSYMDDITNIPITLQTSGNERLSADVELALYRIAQEAISNIVKHAHLTQHKEGHASLDLQFHPQYVQLKIQDNGTGFFLPDKVQGGGTRLGLQSMNSWATKAEAEIEIKSDPRKGTCVTVLVPRQGGKQQ